MTGYFLKLFLLLPLIGMAVWLSLKLTHRMQGRLGGQSHRERSVRIVETMMVSPGTKLAVIEFRGRHILVSASRSGLVRLAEAQGCEPCE